MFSLFVLSTFFSLLFLYVCLAIYPYGVLFPCLFCLFTAFVCLFDGFFFLVFFFCFCFNFAGKRAPPHRPSRDRVDGQVLLRRRQPRGLDPHRPRCREGAEGLLRGPQALVQHGPLHRDGHDRQGQTQNRAEAGVGRGAIDMYIYMYIYILRSICTYILRTVLQQNPTRMSFEEK